MRRFPFGSLLVLAAALAGVIAWQLAAGPDESMPQPKAAAMTEPPARPLPRSRARGEADTWARSALARPLFRSDRRPAAAAEAAPRAAEEPPRLTALLSGPFGRRAIFAGSDGRSTVVREGSALGGWTVLSIGAGAVSVRGRDGERTVRLAFGAGAGAPAPTPAPPSQPDDHEGGALSQRPTAGPVLPPPMPPRAIRR